MGFNNDGDWVNDCGVDGSACPNGATPLGRVGVRVPSSDEEDDDTAGTGTGVVGSITVAEPQRVIEAHAPFHTRLWGLDGLG